MQITYRLMILIRSLALWLLMLFGANTVYANPVSYVLNIQLSPAVCKIDSSQKRARQCLEGYSLTVVGLYPQGATKSCETSNLLNLTPVQKRVLMRIMPDENYQARLWRNVGGCVDMNANQYFRLVTNYAERLKVPAEVSTPTSLRVSKDWLEKRFIQLNPGLTSQSLILQCGTMGRNSNNFLTSIQVCYHTNGRHAVCQIQQTNSCPEHFVIHGSY